MASFRRAQLGTPISVFLSFVFINLIVLAFAGGALAKDIKVEIDEAILLKLERQASDVIVGNPSIADVSVQSGRLLAITGKSFGVTNLIVLDAKGKEVLSKDISVGIDNNRYVTVHKGGARASYHCAPTCQTALIPGDELDHFEGTTKGLRNKFGIAQSVVEGGQAPQ